MAVIYFPAIGMFLLMLALPGMTVNAQTAAVKKQISSNLASGIKETLKFPASYRAGESLYMPLTKGWYNHLDTARLNLEIARYRRIIGLSKRMLQDVQPGSPNYISHNEDLAKYTPTLDSLIRMRDDLSGDDVIGWRVFHKYRAKNIFGESLESEIIVQTDLKGRIIRTEIE